MYCVYFGQKLRITCEAGGLVGFCPKCTYYIETLFILDIKGGKQGGGDVIIDTKQKYFVVKNAFISWVVIDFVDKCVYNM